MTAKAALKSGVARFRARLLLAMMLVVVGITALGVYFAQRNVAATAARDLQQEFDTELASLHRAEELRHQELLARCRTLALKPRIHAALEDNALDLLYPTAKDELRDVIEHGADTESALRATFYRFLDSTGRIIPPLNPRDIGGLSNPEEAQLGLPGAPQTQQIGYIWRQASDAQQTIDEVIAMPIVSTDTGDVIAALVIGFKPLEPHSNDNRSDIKSGIWLHGHLYLPSLSLSGQTTLTNQLVRAIADAKGSESRFTVAIDGIPHLLFYKPLNRESAYPPAYEICVYPLVDALARQRHFTWQIIGLGTLLLLGGFVASHFAAMRLSRPVEELAVTSEENRAERLRAESVLASTSQELERSARFSANASHQLKSPVTVLRAGLESLLARQEFAPEVYDELASLLHQTYRLTGVIDDLLLLSRMDAGHVRINFTSVDLRQLIEEWLDDLSAMTDAAEVEVETQLPPEIRITGEQRYASLIVQNLLENARKYNRSGGRIQLSAREDGDWIVFTVGNTGRPIPQAAQAHIFERFHRGGVGENVPGHGLGLNLARELARLHGGDLRLLRSDEEWTEFEVRFRAAPRTEPAAVHAR